MFCNFNNIYYCNNTDLTLLHANRVNAFLYLQFFPRISVESFLWLRVIDRSASQKMNLGVTIVLRASADGQLFSSLPFDDAFICGVIWRVHILHCRTAHVPYLTTTTDVQQSSFSLISLYSFMKCCEFSRHLFISYSKYT